MSPLPETCWIPLPETILTLQKIADGSLQAVLIAIGLYKNLPLKTGLITLEWKITASLSYMIS
jgi:hypothetical protein